MTNLKEVYEQFRKLDAERTQGEWEKRILGNGGSGRLTLVKEKVFHFMNFESGVKEGDVDFMAYAANNALPALEQAMAEIERLRGALKHLRHNAKKSGACMGIALDVAEEALSETTE